MESYEDTERASGETPVVYSPSAVLERVVIDARLSLSFGNC